jgi:hypothetical protein
MRLAVATALLLVLCGGASAKCVLPKPVKTYLKTHPTWSVVTEADLGSADRASWRKDHKAACPGFAAVELEAGQNSYALAVTNKTRDGRNERLILLHADGKKLTPKTLVPAFQVGDPIVVWRLRAKAVREYGSKRRVAIPRESIRFEKMGMSSKVFYLYDGNVRTVLVADEK